MSIHVETQSGAHYEFAPDMTRVRRVEGGSGNTKRADGEWVALRTRFPKTPAVGYRMVLIMDSLAPLGPDDHGTLAPGGATTRTTTQVVRVWEEA